MPVKTIIDPYHRTLNYLRISITDRCNLRCRYCMPNGFIPKYTHDDILSFEEFLRLVLVFSNMGVDKVRITGGEPLVRKDISHFLKQLTQIAGIADVSLTTNGVLLEEHLDAIQSAGIKRINISLDSLQPDKFRMITGRNYYDKVWRGIQKSHAMGFSPIKLNVVVIKGINDDEIRDLAALTFAYPFHVRFIEFMPVGHADIVADPFFTDRQIRQRVSELGRLIPVERQRLDGPAQRFKLEGAIGEIGLISAMSHHFCHQCNRLRLTANGQLRLCLLSDLQFDLRGPLRHGATDSEMAALILEAVQHKPHHHHVADQKPDHISGQMSSIGG
jgi:cyclic pyranopterin phosphate synthase